LQIWRPERKGEQQQQNKFKLVKFNGLYHEMENAEERVAYLHQKSIADQHFGDLNDRENSGNRINISLSSLTDCIMRRRMQMKEWLGLPAPV
jgi:hypothetical protein